METENEALMRKARDMAWALGITVYVRDGAIHQYGPGIEVERPPGSIPEQAGRGPISEPIAE